MDFLSRITALMPFAKKKEAIEYFFALNIAQEKLTCALWSIANNQLKILETASDTYASLDDLTKLTDKLLDETLGIKELEPQKILFGVPSAWLADENLKSEKLKVLRELVKELELVPMAYVESSHALVHFLEKTEGIPPTAILVGFETRHLTVTVVRAGKIDGVRVVLRGENSGTDIEKALLTVTSVETLPSKMLIYGSDTGQLKNQLLSFPWMSKLSFLHFPKIDKLPEDIEIKSISFAGASEIDSNVSYAEAPIRSASVQSTQSTLITKDSEDAAAEDRQPESPEGENLGFMVGDISAKEREVAEDAETTEEETDSLKEHEAITEEFAIPQETRLIETEDFEHELPAPAGSNSTPADLVKPAPKKFLPGKFKHTVILALIIGAVLLALSAYLLLPKAEVKIFVEPKILEKDTTVTADPNQKTVNEEGKIIPGQIIETDVSGSAKDTASGKRQIGDPAKGTIVIINNTDKGQSFSTGTVLTGPGGLKFKLDKTASVSATAADADSKSTVTVTVTAIDLGADGNLPSKTNLTIGSFSASQFVARAEGNFSGGTSKEATVVSSEDQQRLLAKLSSDLRGQAQQKLQEQFNNKKVLQEALSENITKKSYNKNLNDQATEFSLNLTIKYKGTAFEDKDLKSIVSKLVTTQVPEGFQLNLEDTETQAEVSKLEKDGKLIFLAKFKAKLLPKIDTDKIKNQIKGKSLSEAANAIKSMDNILGSEIKISPKLPPVLQRLPVLGKNIKIEAGLK